ncbi:hypothetical protein Dalk_1875 [Desulfatibacillum aliphaticivorans]|uniref:EF-hand domain-containing protein n=1 Tax=Desulfatibacillum aliphaticivorans TaxID=218208 RepID=B8FEP5_DESAL|nr:hypothetical protein [Desulfatibacillum aliphaticivorans]ACL03572.1 hypothetical protein Dalk_1875 [Desulfatibacillum aliphaticivorans]
MKKAIVAILVLLTFLSTAHGAVIGDIDGDGQITLNEAIYALQTVAGFSGQGLTQEEQGDYQQSTDQTILYMNDPNGETAVENLLAVFDALGLIAAVESGDAYAYLANASNFSCGSVADNGANTVTFTLSGCGMVGTIVVTVSTDGQYTVFSMTFTDVNYNGCVINGAATVKVAVSGDTATIIIQSTALSVCGAALNGSITIVMDKNTGEIDTVTVANTTSFTMDDGTVVDITAEITYNPDGTIDGTATTSMDGQDYSFVINGVTVDPACGIPNSGTISINGFVMDFSNTTCDDPTVVVYIRGVPVEMNLEDALNLVLGEEAVNFLMEELASMVSGVEDMNDAVEMLNLDNAMDDSRKVLGDPDTIYNNLRTADFACGSVSVGLLARQVVFDFDPASECGVDGVITVTVTKPESAIIFEMDYDQVTVGTCTIDGQASSTLSFDSGNITYTHTSSNLTACGATLNGTFSVTVDATDGSLESASMANAVTYDTGNGQITVVSDLTRDSQGVSGNVDLTTDDGYYECTLYNIIIDWACGIPNGGILVVNGVVLDFSNTTCDNPVVTATVRGVSAQLSLEDAVNLLKAEDPATYMLNFLSGADQVTEGLEGLQEVMEQTGIQEAQEKYGFGDRKAYTVDEVLNEIATTFGCGDIAIIIGAPALSLEFDGTCGITGTLTITGTQTQDGIDWAMDFNQIVVEGCVIDGQTQSTLIFGDGAVLFQHTSSNLSLCGNELAGTFTVSVDSTTGSLNYIAVDTVAEFEYNQKSVAVDAEVFYMPGAGLSGDAILTVDEKTFDCTFDNITIDPACGIPNGGTMTINGVTLDFSATTCDDPTVAVSAGNLSTTMSIDEVINLLMMEDPINALLAAVGGDNSTQEAIAGLLDEAGLWEAEDRLRARKIAGTVSDLFDFYDGFTFACGNLQVAPVQKKITITFDGTEPCYATGEVIVEVDKPDDTFIYTLTFNNVATQACNINGQTTGSFVWGDSTVTFTHTSSNLQFCASTFNGSSAFVINTNDGSLESVTVDTDISLEMDGESVTIQAKLVYDSNGINGTADIKKGRKTYECVFENVTIDTDCGIPNGGTITVNGVEVDFSSTSCVNPYVTVTVRGRSVQMSLEDAVAMLW